MNLALTFLVVVLSWHARGVDQSDADVAAAIVAGGSGSVKEIHNHRRLLGRVCAALDDRNG